MEKKWQERKTENDSKVRGGRERETANPANL